MTTQPSQEAVPPTELRLEGEHDLSTLQALEDPSQLTTLILHECDLSDLSPLVGLPQLTSLTLINCAGVRSLTPWPDSPNSTR